VGGWAELTVLVADVTTSMAFINTSATMATPRKTYSKQNKYRPPRAERDHMFSAGSSMGSDSNPKKKLRPPSPPPPISRTRLSPRKLSGILQELNHSRMVGLRVDRQGCRAGPTLV
jgi:hypothetical protein